MVLRAHCPSGTVFREGCRREDVNGKAPVSGLYYPYDTVIRTRDELLQALVVSPGYFVCALTPSLQAPPLWEEHHGSEDGNKRGTPRGVPHSDSTRFFAR